MWAADVCPQATGGRWQLPLLPVWQSAPEGPGGEERRWPERVPQMARSPRETWEFGVSVVSAAVSFLSPFSVSAIFTKRVLRRGRSLALPKHSPSSPFLPRALPASAYRPRSRSPTGACLELFLKSCCPGQGSGFQGFYSLWLLDQKQLVMSGVLSKKGLIGRRVQER